MFIQLFILLQCLLPVNSGQNEPTVDTVLPKVAPHVSRYGFFRYQEKKETEGYHAHQSIAYYPGNANQQKDPCLLFGIKKSESDSTPTAYIYQTDMRLNEKARYPLDSAYHINDMMFNSAYSELMIAPLHYDESNPEECSVIRVYSWPLQPSNNDTIITPIRDINLFAHFNGTHIDSFCNSREDSMYVVKGGNKIVFFDYEFHPTDSCTIDTDDAHGDLIIQQALEYYKGYILQLNAGDFNEESMGKKTKNAYLNIYRRDGTKVDTFRYPDCDDNMEAEGICSIGGGKFLFTHYGGTRIEVRLLDFNVPTHTHTYADIVDLDKLGISSVWLYVNPELEGKSYLTPDGSEARPFPNVAEAIDYARVFLSRATLILMDGNHGSIDLNNIYMDLCIRGNNKDKCFVDKVFVNKCRDVLFEFITFTNATNPFEAYSADLQIYNCSFPNGQKTGQSPIGNYAININRNSSAAISACEIKGFNSAVKVNGSTLLFESTWGMFGSNNYCAIRGEKCVILGAGKLTETFYTNQFLSADDCILDYEAGAVTSARSSAPSRPKEPSVGQCFFDTSLNKPLWWNGSEWVDASGTSH